MAFFKGSFLMLEAQQVIGRLVSESVKRCVKMYMHATTD
jgi:hypothetical protein